MENEEFDLCLLEAKDHLKHVNNSIKETRSKTYYLLGIMIGIISFLIVDIFSFNLYTVKSQMFIISLPFLNSFIWINRQTFNPTGLRFEGMTPNSFKEILDGNLKENILNTYQTSIDNNVQILQNFSKSYKLAFNIFVLWLFCLCVFCIYMFITKGFIC